MPLLTKTTFPAVSVVLSARSWVHRMGEVLARGLPRIQGINLRPHGNQQQVAAASGQGRIRVVVHTSVHAAVFDQPQRFLQVSQAVAKTDFLLVALQTYGVVGKERPAARSGAPPPKSMSKRKPRTNGFSFVSGWLASTSPTGQAGAGRSTSRRSASPSGKTASHWLGSHAGVARHVGELLMKLPEASGGIAHAAGTKIAVAAISASKPAWALRSVPVFPETLGRPRP